MLETKIAQRTLRNLSEAEIDMVAGGSCPGDPPSGPSDLTESESRREVNAQLIIIVAIDDCV